MTLAFDLHCTIYETRYFLSPSRHETLILFSHWININGISFPL